MAGYYSLLPLLPEANIVPQLPAELGEGLLLEVAVRGRLNGCHPLE